MNYLYSGPISGVTLRLADGSERDVMLHDGATVDLPEGHDYVAALLAQGRLKRVPEPAETGPAPGIPGPAKRRNTQGSSE